MSKSGNRDIIRSRSKSQSCRGRSHSRCIFINLRFSICLKIQFKKVKTQKMIPLLQHYFLADIDEEQMICLVLVEQGQGFWIGAG